MEIQSKQCSVTWQYFIVGWNCLEPQNDIVNELYRKDRSISEGQGDSKLD